MAISASAAVIPIAVEKYGKHFVICPGEMIDPIRLQADKHRLTIILRDELASLKWKIWEREGICQRNTLPTLYWEKFIQERRSKWKGYSIREQVANTYIPKDIWEYWQIQKSLRTREIPLWYQIYLEENVPDSVIGENK